MDLPEVGKLYLAFDVHQNNTIQELQIVHGVNQDFELSIFIPNGTWVQILSVEPDYTKFPDNASIRKIREDYGEDDYYLQQWFQADIRWGDKTYRHCWFSKHAWQNYLWDHSFEDWEPDVHYY